MQCTRVSFLYSLFILCVYCTATKLPDFVQTCSRNSPDSSLCLKNALEKLRPHLVKGIPEMKIPPITPLILPRVALSQENSSSVNFRSIMKNLRISGLENYEIRDITLDLDKPFLSWKINFPKIDLFSDFTAKGRLLVIGFDGEGILDSKINDVAITGEWTGKRITKNKKEHLVFELTKDICRIRGSMSCSIKNLFKGNPELDENFNRVIQENSNLLRPDIEPVLGKIITDITTQFIDVVFNLYSFDQLFPDN